MSVIDTVNRVFRDFKRYTGDGLPGEPTGAPLPLGDPQSGAHSPKKSEIRAAMLGQMTAVGETLDDAEAALADLLGRYLGAHATDAAATAAAGTPAVGQLYWNTTSDILKTWNGSGWVSATQSAGNIIVSTDVGDGGTSYVLDADAQATNTILAIGGVVQSGGYTLVDGALEVTGGVPADLPIFAMSFEIVPLGTTTASLVSTSDGGTVQGSLDHLRSGRYGNSFKSGDYDDDIQAAMDACSAAGGGVVEINKRGTIAMTSGLLVPTNVELIGYGGDQTILDFSGVASADLAQIGASRFAMLVKGAGLTLVDQTHTSILPGETKITFGSAHGLISAGDIISIYKPANSSFHGARAEYRSGERNRVVDIQGGTVHWLAGKTLDVYAYGGGEDADIYVQAQRTGRFGGFTIDLHGSAVPHVNGAKWHQVNDVEIDDLNIEGALYAGGEISQGYNVRGSRLRWSTLLRSNFNSDGLTPSGNDYASIITNSTDVILSGQFRGNWSGTDFGGSNETGASQNYRCEYRDSVIAGTAGSHGCSQECGYRNCEISDAASMCGKDAYIIGGSVTIREKNYATCIDFSEMKGGTFLIQDVDLFSTKNAGAGSRAAIDINCGETHDTYLTEDILIRLSGVRMRMPLETQPLRAISKNATYRMSLDVDIALADVPLASELVRIQRASGSGTLDGRVFRMSTGHLVQSSMSPLYVFAGGYGAARVVDLN